MSNEPQLDLIDDLLAVREILKKGWCQNYYAVDKEGKETTIGAANVHSFCIIGAIRKHTAPFAEVDNRRRRFQAYNSITNQLNRGDQKHKIAIVFYNDNVSRTQSDVLVLLDNTIKWEQDHAES